MPDAMTPTDVKPNSYLDGLADTEFVAVDATGSVLCRASDRESAAAAAPEHAALFSGADFRPKRAPAKKPLEPDATDDQPISYATPDAVVDGAAFDHDDDGKVGGSRKRKPNEK